jgi:tetratricopeptide (TPR) repeat protein
MFNKVLNCLIVAVVVMIVGVVLVGAGFFFLTRPTPGPPMPTKSVETVIVEKEVEIVVRETVEVEKEVIKTVEVVQEVEVVVAPTRKPAPKPTLRPPEPAKPTRTDDQSAGAYYSRGLAYAKGGDWGKAIANYTKTIELKPDYGPVYFSRGYCYLQLKDYDKAIANIKKAIDLGVSDKQNAIETLAVAYYSRGFAYDKQGEYERAIDDLRYALELGLEESYEKRAEALLEKLIP